MRPSRSISSREARSVHQANEDRGFTLIELLLAMFVAVLVMGSIGAVLIMGLRSNDSSLKRLDESRDAQRVALYLNPDVESATSFYAVASQSAANAASPGNTQCSGQKNLVALSW